MLNYYYPAILLKKKRIFALEFILIAIAMNNVSFPKITTTVQAEPWAEGHVARFTSTRVVPQTHVRIVTSQQTYCHDERT